MISRRLALSYLAGCLAGCATSASKIVSPAPQYTGERPVKKLAIYVFVDLRQEYVGQAFRSSAEAELGDGLSNAGVESFQVWFSDTYEAQAYRDNPKDRTLGNSTFVSVGKVISAHQGDERRLGATHRLIVFPKDLVTGPQTATMDVKWDIYDASNGNLEWSVFTRTTNLRKNAPPDASKAAGRAMVKAAFEEFRRRHVISA